MQDRIRHRAFLLLAIFLAGGMLAPVLHPLSHSLQSEPSRSDTHSQATKPAFENQEQHSHRAAVCSFCGHLFVKIFFSPAVSPAYLQVSALISAARLYLPTSARLTLHSRGPPSRLT